MYYLYYDNDGAITTVTNKIASSFGAAYIEIDKKVSIHNKSTWKDAMVFLNESMISFENFYDLYENTIKS